MMSTCKATPCQIAWEKVPLRRFFPLSVVPLIEVLLYSPFMGNGYVSCKAMTRSLQDCQQEVVVVIAAVAAY